MTDETTAGSPLAGKLYEVNITPHAPASPEREIDLLLEKYGQPSERRTAAYQNAYGAKWECPEVFWNMPDGTSIFADEYIGSDYYGAPQRRMLITFRSKEADDERKARSKPNPYRSPK